MDLGSRNFAGSRGLSPARSVDGSVLRPPLHSSSGTSFPIIAIAVIGILATALLLVSYYIFVIKCCLNWHRIDLLRRFSLSRGRNQDDPLMVYSPAAEPRGLDESVIRSIPIFRFRTGTDNRDFYECAVCLNEFEEDEKLRMIPDCSHVFHIDCIDVWLQSNANCPLCRTSISPHRTVARSPPPLAPNPLTESSIQGDEDFVVIELGGVVNENSANGSSLGREERSNTPPPGAASPRPMSPRKLNKVASMGDECIDMRRNKDEQFQVQPIRRSISMDSSADRQLFVAVQEMVSQQNRQGSEVSSMEGCSSSGSGRGKRSFFSFGHGSRGSRSSSVLPLYLEP